MNATRICDASGPEWLEARKQGIGASEAATACGLSEYATPAELYHRKRGEIPPLEETDAMRRGTLLEPVVRAEFEHKTGHLVDTPVGLWRSTSHSFMQVTPDGIIPISKQGSAERFIGQQTDAELFEAKTTSGHRARILGLFDGDGELPAECADWICQVQHGMAVMGLQVARVAVLIDAATFQVYTVPRNDRLISGIVAAERELWERIQSGDPPPIKWTHPAVLDLVTELFETVKETAIVLSEDAGKAWGRYESVGKVIRDLEKQRKADKARVLAEIGEHEKGILPGGERMVRRQRITSHVQAHDKDYIDVRAVKNDGAVPSSSVDSDVLADRYEIADRELKAAGFLRHDVSEYGSCYYIHSSNARRIRVSDHPPNVATGEWMVRSGCKSIRIDNVSDSELIAELQKVIL